LEEGSTTNPGTIQLSVQPNPFSTYLEITYDLPATSEVDLAIYDITGRLITAETSAFTSAGSHSVSWNTENLPVGSYQVVLNSCGERAVRRAVLLR